MKKIAISSSILMLCLSLIQTALFSHIPFFLITADLALVYIVFVAIHNGSRSAMLLGFATGLFLDFMSLSPLGLSSFILTFIAFFFGKTLWKIQPKSYFIFVYFDSFGNFY